LSRRPLGFHASLLVSICPSHHPTGQSVVQCARRDARAAPRWSHRGEATPAALQDPPQDRGGLDLDGFSTIVHAALARIRELLSVT